MPLRTARSRDPPSRRRSRSAPILGAKKAELPSLIKPQLADLAAHFPSRGEWIYEMKFDGYRLLTRIEAGETRLYTRGGHNWAAKMPELVCALSNLELSSGWLDGEIVVVLKGAPNFQELQTAFRKRATAAQIQYYLFDLPFIDGYDLRNCRLIDRRAQLQQLLIGARAPLHFSQALDVPPDDLLGAACEAGFEGLIGKRIDARYESRRSSLWLKHKCGLRQEFVIVGYTIAQHTRASVGALLLAYLVNGELVYAGKVGTGFTDASRRDAAQVLAPLAVETPPFILRATDRLPKGARWVRPKLVAEVAFAEWTKDGHIRHPSFKGLRTDKSWREIRREQPVDRIR